MPKMEVDVDKCKGCYLCIQVCPKKCIEKSSKFSKTGYYPASCCAPERCTGCGLCAQVCPDLAISVFKEEKK